MKTNLPESRNRNLPQPPAHAAPVESRRRMMPPDSPTPDEPGRGTSALRSFVVMLIIGGLFAGGIWYYLRGAESEARVHEQLSASLAAIGTEIWETTTSLALTTDSEEAQKDFDDLPRVIGGIRAWAKSRGVLPRNMSLENDPQPGKHQIQYFFGDKPMLIIRVACRELGGPVYFLGEANDRLVKSRKEFYEALNPPEPAASPDKAPAPEVPPPAAEDKVSEPPANPQ